MKKYPIYDIEQFNCNTVNSDLYINTFKKHLQNHSFIEKPHRHNFYVLVFFTAGSGTHEVDFDWFEIQSGSVFVLQPGQMHHWDLSQHIDGFIVFYSKEIYNLYFGQKELSAYPFYATGNTSPEIILDADEVMDLKNYFSVLMNEVNGNQILKQDKIMNVLDIIHVELARKYVQNHIHEAHSYNIKVSNFGLLLEQNFKNEKTPFFYATQLHVSLKHLNRICKEILNKTTTQVITQRIILEAKRMLLEKRFSVNEIASELGYDDYSYFTRLFKKNTGMSPSIFRSQKY